MLDPIIRTGSIVIERELDDGKEKGSSLFQVGELARTSPAMR
jgi:hypothetical protein